MLTYISNSFFLGASHVFVDKKSEQGNVYVKCPTILAAHRSVMALHGRLFAGKTITANYVPINSYYDHFPEARNAVKVSGSFYGSLIERSF